MARVHVGGRLVEVPDTIDADGLVDLLQVSQNEIPVVLVDGTSEPIPIVPSTQYRLQDGAVLDKIQRLPLGQQQKGRTFPSSPRLRRKHA